jgi:Fe-S-cluster containining protein
MRFQCQPGCIRCCEEKGFIYVTPEDIAAHVGLSRAEFRRKYLCGTAPLLRFRKPRNGQCSFLKADGCAVHEIKPMQCRSFPFWPELLDNASARREAAAYCPGLNRGPLVNIAQARKIADQIQAAFPQLYDPPLNKTDRQLRSTKQNRS